MKKALGINAKLTAGHGGVFDVTVDGRLVYSKFQTGRFPQQREITKLISHS